MSQSPDYQRLPGKSSPLTLDSWRAETQEASRFPFEQARRNSLPEPHASPRLPTKDSTSLATIWVKAAHLFQSSNWGSWSLCLLALETMTPQPFQKVTLSTPGPCHHHTHSAFLWLHHPPELQARPIKDDFGVKITILSSDLEEWPKEVVGGNQS